MVADNRNVVQFLLFSKTCQRGPGWMRRKVIRTSRCSVDRDGGVGERAWGLSGLVNMQI